jgi:hypothetical protein
MLELLQSRYSVSAGRLVNTGAEGGITEIICTPFVILPQASEEDQFLKKT